MPLVKVSISKQFKTVTLISMPLWAMCPVTVTASAYGGGGTWLSRTIRASQQLFYLVMPCWNSRKVATQLPARFLNSRSLTTHFNAKPINCLNLNEHTVPDYPLCTLGTWLGAPRAQEAPPCPSPT
jgi:hypothetical protein